MKTIYLDSEFRCHLSDDGNGIAIETDFFDGKCDVYTEGYRVVPVGESWIRFDGEVFHGPMIAPWKNPDELNAAQRVYERQLLTEYSEANSKLEQLNTSYQEGINSI